MKKKLIIVALCCMAFCVHAFADEMGPNTARYKDYFKETGEYLFQYNDCSMARLMNMGKNKNAKMKPSQVITLAKQNDKKYSANIFIGKYKGLGGNICIIKDGKKYELDNIKKEGTVAELTSVNLAKNGYILPPGLITVLCPDTLTDPNAKLAEQLYKYQGKTTETFDNVNYECETYGSAGMGLKVLKLYFIDGELVKFSENGNLADVLQISNKVDAKIFAIPRGFTIYAAQVSDVEKLLNQRTVVEQY